MNPYARDLGDHYAAGDVLGRVEAALAQAGLDVRPGALDPDDLAPLDHFHTGGRVATEQLLALAGGTGWRRILDLGCGVGGAARFLARRCPGARVTGVDIVEEYCRVARRLNALAGLEAVEIVCADLTELPPLDPPCDLVWSQHALMNVPDKPAVLAAVRAHLAPGGAFAFHEAFAGEGGPPHLPVPWAGEGTPSHLVAAADWRALLGAGRLVERAWRDTTQDALDWIDATVAARRNGETPATALSLAPLMGPEAALKSRNLRRNLLEGRVRLAMGVYAAG